MDAMTDVTDSTSANKRDKQGSEGIVLQSRRRHAQDIAHNSCRTSDTQRPRQTIEQDETEESTSAATEMEDAPTEQTSNVSSSGSINTHGFAKYAVPLPPRLLRQGRQVPGAFRVYPPGTLIIEPCDDILESNGVSDAAAVEPVAVVDEVLIGVAVVPDDELDLAPVAATLLKGRYVKRRRLVLLIVSVISILCVVGIVVGVTTRADRGGNTPQAPTFTAPPTVDKLAMSLPSSTIAALQNELPAAQRNARWYTDKAWFNSSILQARSPQGKAWQWLMSLPALSDQLMATKQFALATLYFATNGTNWKNASNWLSPTAHICDWFPGRFGEECYEPNGFRSLVLSNNDLQGLLPPELGLLTGLDVVKFAGNALHGTIHTDIWASWSQVQVLDLYSNRFTGQLSTTLGSFMNLRILSAGSNSFTGSIPTDLGFSTSITDLDLTDNLLSGTISPEIALYRKLRSIDLSGNNMVTGTIPTEVGQLHDLEILSMVDCNVTGTLPTQLSKLEILRSLDVSGTRISGTVPVEYGKLSRLIFLQIQETNISGSIPTAVCQSFLANRASDGIVVDCSQVLCDCNCSCAQDVI